MSQKRKWQDEHLCLWCFEQMGRFQMYYCSDYCKEEAKRWKDREDSLAKEQKRAQKDLQRHNAEIVGDSPDDYPIEEDNIND